MRSNKEMKLAGAQPIGRPQLISGVGPTPSGNRMVAGVMVESVRS
jgi:hypothetical protein